MGNFKGDILNNHDDDMRILESLPTSYKPQGMPLQDQMRGNSAVKQDRGNKSFNASAGKRSMNGGAADHLQSKDVKMEGPLGQFIDKITIHGFNCNSIPAITNLTYFMNLSMLLKNNKKYKQAEEIDFLVGVLLITTKRAV